MVRNGLLAVLLVATSAAFAQDKPAEPKGAPKGEPKADAKAAAQPADASKGEAPAKPADQPGARPKPRMSNKMTVTPIPPKKQSLPPLVKNWEKIDADKDGKSSYEEVRKIIKNFPEDRFKYLDKNQDRLLDRGELPKAGEPRTMLPPSRNTPPGAQPLLELLKIADKNSDSVLTPEEYAAAYPQSPETGFRALDHNGDGKIDMVDFPTADPKGGVKSADVDKDGKVSREEFAKRYPESKAGRFENLDRNGDGVLDDTDHDTSKTRRNLPQVAPKQQWTSVVGRLLAELDKDKDGKLTFEEYSKGKPDATREAFDALDTDKDGAITRADEAPKDKAVVEKMVKQLPATGPDRMKHADKDGDGKLTFEEASAEFKNLTKERFEERDLNKDGFLDAQDRALRQAAPANPTTPADPAAKPAADAKAPATSKSEEKPAAPTTPKK